MRDISSVRGYVTPSDEWPDVESVDMTEGGVAFRMLVADNIYDSPAFFNPVMVLNRDIAILFCHTYAMHIARKIRFFEPLAGIGIRALRIASEIPNDISEIVINDLGEISTKIAAYNISKLGLGDIVHLFKREARSLTSELAETRFKYNFIDLDPFGPPTPFIDAMWGLTTLSSLIAVTATDMQALAGVYPKACLRKYGGLPLNNHHTHETASRLLIAMVARSAGRFDRAVTPLFTSCVDHYVKVIFLTTQRKGDAIKSVEQIGYSYTCEECTQIQFIAGDMQEIVCCDSQPTTAGPLWTGEIFDTNFCQMALDNLPALDLPSSRRLTKQLEEAVEAHHLPGYYSMKVLARKLHISQPSFSSIREELENLGYRFVQTRFTKQAFRSDAPGDELIKILVKLNMNSKKIE